MQRLVKPQRSKNGNINNKMTDNSPPPPSPSPIIDDSPLFSIYQGASNYYRAQLKGRVLLYETFEEAMVRVDASLCYFDEMFLN